MRWYIHIAREWNCERGSMGTNILYGNGHSGPTQGEGPEPIVSWCASTVSCTTPGGLDPAHC